jgi:histidinol-phosphate aminotransferase
VAVAGAIAGVTVNPISHAAATKALAMPRYGPPPNAAKLNANENPYGPSEAALNAMADACRQGAYYAGASVPILQAMIAERNGVTPEQVSLSAGSSGVLTYVAIAASRTGKILGPDLFWDTTAMAAERYGGEIVRVPNTPELGIDLDAMYAAIDDSISLVHITNPNNPTGTLIDGDRLRAFCRKASKKTMVLVDEAYNELTDNPDRHSMVDLVRAGHNVVVARTFSKIFGLAGMRVGYLIASPENTALVDRYGLGSYAMNQAGVAAAIASYDDAAFIAHSKSKIVQARQMVQEAVQEAELRALPSATNFVFVNLGALDADQFQQKMAARGVLIRGTYGKYSHWSRVSMGHLEAVNKYVAALPAVLDEMAMDSAETSTQAVT